MILGILFISGCVQKGDSQNLGVPKMQKSALMELLSAGIRNNCEFFECSDEKPIPVEPDGGIGITTPYVQYVAMIGHMCRNRLDMQ